MATPLFRRPFEPIQDDQKARKEEPGHHSRRFRTSFRIPRSAPKEAGRQPARPAMWPMGRPMLPRGLDPVDEEGAREFVFLFFCFFHSENEEPKEGPKIHYIVLRC